jgi:DNA repair exonuclease SbcCD ATPase subunit
MNNNHSQYKTLSVSSTNNHRKKYNFFTPKLSYKVTKSQTPQIKYFSPIRYNIAFNSKSNKDIITSPPYIQFPTRNYEIQTLCKDYHSCLYKTDTKKHISNYIDTIETKMNLFAYKLKQNEKTISEYEDDNLEIIFKLTNKNNKSKNVMKELQNEKNEIEELKNALNNLNKQTHNYSVEEIKSRENTFAMEEKIKSLKVNIENENNIVTDMKQKVKELKMKVVALRKILDPPSAKFSLFLKDVAKLISHKPI